MLTVTALPRYLESEAIAANAVEMLSVQTCCEVSVCVQLTAALRHAITIGRTGKLHNGSAKLKKLGKTIFAEQM